MRVPDNNKWKALANEAIPGTTESYRNACTMFKRAVLIRAVVDQARPSSTDADIESKQFSIELGKYMDEHAATFDSEHTEQKLGLLQAFLVEHNMTLDEQALRVCLKPLASQVIHAGARAHLYQVAMQRAEERTALLQAKHGKPISSEPLASNIFRYLMFGDKNRNRDAAPRSAVPTVEARLSKVPRV